MPEIGDEGKAKHLPDIGDEGWVNTCQISVRGMGDRLNSCPTSVRGDVAEHLSYIGEVGKLDTCLTSYTCHTSVRGRGINTCANAVRG